MTTCVVLAHSTLSFCEHANLHSATRAQCRSVRQFNGGTQSIGADFQRDVLVTRTTPRDWASSSMRLLRRLVWLRRSDRRYWRKPAVS